MSGMVTREKEKRREQHWELKLLLRDLLFRQQLFDKNEDTIFYYRHHRKKKVKDS